MSSLTDLPYYYTKLSFAFQEDFEFFFYFFAPSHKILATRMRFPHVSFVLCRDGSNLQMTGCNIFPHLSTSLHGKFSRLHRIIMTLSHIRHGFMLCYNYRKRERRLLHFFIQKGAAFPTHRHGKSRPRPILYTISPLHLNNKGSVHIKRTQTDQRNSVPFCRFPCCIQCFGQALK